jgi:hypothetical protein
MGTQADCTSPASNGRARRHALPQCLPLSNQRLGGSSKVASQSLDRINNRPVMRVVQVVHQLVDGHQQDSLRFPAHIPRVAAQPLGQLLMRAASHFDDENENRPLNSDELFG